MSGPNRQQWAASNAAVMQAALAVLTALHERPPTDAEKDALTAKLNEAAGRVRGNRPETAKVTWADERRLLAAVLRMLVEELERP